MVLGFVWALGTSASSNSGRIHPEAPQGLLATDIHNDFLTYFPIFHVCSFLFNNTLVTQFINAWLKLNPIHPLFSVLQLTQRYFSKRIAFEGRRYITAVTSPKHRTWELLLKSLLWCHFEGNAGLLGDEVCNLPF
jgi:hypothetical protein